MPATFTDLLSAFIAIMITILATIVVQAHVDGHSNKLIMQKVKTALVVILPNFAVLLMVCYLAPGVLRKEG